MKGITIHPVSADSAHGMIAALSRFHPELIEAADGRYEIVVSLDGGDRDIVAILKALEEYVTERASGHARLELDGRSYVMQANDWAPDRPVNAGADT